MLGFSMNSPITTEQSEHKQIARLSELDDATLSNIQIPSGWCPLDDRGLICVSGEEAEVFLQGQLTQDMALVKKGQSFFAAHCTPKGRILFLFFCGFWQGQFYLDLPLELEATALKRLMMYKLRAKVILESAANKVARSALWGDAMRISLQDAGWEVPEEAGATTQSANGLLTCVSKGCWRLMSSSSYAKDLRDQLSLQTPPSLQAWLMSSVRAGEPEVLAVTTDTWIPQMLNLDLLQGVSFKKGCYTGQEIVARAHFLGRVKRRMRLFAYVGDTPPVPGQNLQFNIEDSANLDRNVLLESQVNEVDEENINSAQVVRAVELQTGQGWVLAVTKLPVNDKPKSSDHTRSENIL